MLVANMQQTYLTQTKVFYIILSDDKQKEVFPMVITESEIKRTYILSANLYVCNNCIAEFIKNNQKGIFL